MARKYAGSNSIWNFWDKIKSRVIKDEAGEVDKGLSKKGVMCQITLHSAVKNRIPFHIIPIQRQSRWELKRQAGQ